MIAFSVDKVDTTILITLPRLRNHFYSSITLHTQIHNSNISQYIPANIYINTCNLPTTLVADPIHVFVL